MLPRRADSPGPVEGAPASRPLAIRIEWNYRTVSSAEGTAFAEVARAFQGLFAHPATKELTPDWIER